MARSLNLEMIADVLEKTAAYIDQRESEKIAHTTRMSQEEVSKLASAYEEITGEALAGEVKAKLADDAALRQTIIAVVDSSKAPASLGQGATKVAKAAGEEEGSEQSYSTRTTQAKKKAWDQFGHDVTQK